MNVTLRQLQVFVTVAEETHFGRAAARLHVSQPVISQELRRLEKGLNTRLFDRTTRTVRLTGAGAALLDDARELGAAADAFVTRARRLSDAQPQQLRIAVTPSVLDEILPIVLRRAEDALPGAELTEVPVETGEIENALLRRDCDVGLGRFVTPPSHHRAEQIRSEAALVALSARHPLAAHPAVDLAELAELPLLLWPREQNPDYYDALIRICTERGLEPTVSTGPPRLVGGRSYLIADGRAFCLIPASTAHRITDGISTRPLSRPAGLPLSMIWRARDPRPAVAGLLGLIRKVGAEQDGRQPQLHT